MERRNLIKKSSTNWRPSLSTVDRLDSHDRSNPSMLTVSPFQIKNIVAAATALAVYQNTKVFMSHLELVTNLNEEFESDLGKDSNKHAYV
jgi:hypothetical protein